MGYKNGILSQILIPFFLQCQTFSEIGCKECFSFSRMFYLILHLGGTHFGLEVLTKQLAQNPKSYHFL